MCSPLAKVKKPSDVFNVDTGSCADSFPMLQKTRSRLENEEFGSDKLTPGEGKYRQQQDCSHSLSTDDAHDVSSVRLSFPCAP